MESLLSLHLAVRFMEANRIDIVLAVYNDLFEYKHSTYTATKCKMNRRFYFFMRLPSEEVMVEKIINKSKDKQPN